MDPVPTVLATALPEMEPIKPLAKIEILAGPPFRLPSRAMESCIKNSPAPELSKNAANNMNKNTKVDEIVVMLPNNPSGAKYIRYNNRLKCTPLK